MLKENFVKSLVKITENYLQLEKSLNDPEVVSDIKKYTKLSKQIKQISPVFHKYQEYLKTKKLVEDSKELLNTEKDEDILVFAKEELKDAQSKISDIEDELQILLLPKDEADERNVIIEIRGAAGGEEANIFAADLYRMYTKYSETQKWKIELMESSTSEAGGLSFVSFSIKGDSVYAQMKFEAGSHRVQRIPETETNGRIHTSTSVVTVLPEIEDDSEVEIRSKDLKVDTYRASGAGGQHVNTTDSAVRITHLPSGIVVTSQDGRSQHANREQALRVLKSKLYERKRAEKAEKEGVARKIAGSGFRAEKIRTYNYPQNRVTDHRIKYTSNNLDRIIEGDLGGVIGALQNAEQAEKLKAIQ